MCLETRKGESTVGQFLLNVSVALLVLAYGLLALALPHRIRKVDA